MALTSIATLALLLVAAPGEYRQAALGAAGWLEKCAAGPAWPADPEQPGKRPVNLYHGSAGVVLFFLEAHRATGAEAYLARARAGADHLLASLPDKETGLYTGAAGIGFVLQQVFEATGDKRYRAGVRRCVETIRKTGWGETTDIIGGTAGVGLFLLRVEETELAEAAGRHLLKSARPAGEGGRKWPMDQRFARLMPNFSHGTAGVSYFLATLYDATRRKEFLDAARAGARYLQSAAPDCLVFHHEPGGEKLFYLGWCHGPAGTGRLFYRLWRTTGEKRWREWLERSAASVMKSGIPEKRPPGFWNNVGVCCGSAGVAEFFLDLHRATGKAAYLAFSKRITTDLLARATKDERGLYWVHAEHRVRPKLLRAQTGYMQGAAGIGLWLLKLDAFESGRKHRTRLPDSPFP